MSRRRGDESIPSSWIRACVVLIACVCGALIWPETRGAADPGKENVAMGKALFVRHCAGCHGPEGRGNGYKLLGPDPANLTAITTKKKVDEDLLRTIHEGKPNMPAWKAILSTEEIRNVLTYIRTLTP
ncbi:MAG: c-type cytochrome [Nitrospira sp. CR1.3]|nr:c-type cytochrome [Nitrospira sp. CR1.3]